MTGPKETHHLRHIAQSGRFGTPVLKQILEESSRQPYFVTFSFGGISLRSLESPWGFWFPKQLFWKSNTQTNIGRGQSTPLFTLFCDTFLRENELTFSQLLIHLWSFWFPIRPCLSSASFPERGHSPWAPPQRVWNRSETTLKHLPVHHLRLYALSVTASLLYIAF